MATIQGVYVALFGRPADPLGLSFFNTATNNGANLTAIGNLASTKEYTDRFTGFNNNQIVNSIYQSLFNRDAEPAGLAFFVDALNKGTLNINNIAIAILDGAQGNDKAILDAKIASANLFTAALDTPAEVGAYIGNTAAAAGRLFLSAVTTSTPATVAAADAAILGIVTAGAAGNTITLAAGTVNNVTVGTAATNTTDKNDTINALEVANAVGPVVANTNALDAFVFGVGGDTIDGGFGTDTLNVAIDAGGLAVAANQLKSVELIYVTSKDDAGALNVTEAKEATQVWNKGSDSNLAVTGIKLTTTVGVEGSITALKTTSFGFADAGGSADSAALALKDATATGGVTINSIETLSVSNSGTSAINVVGDTLKAVVVTGSGTLASNFATAPNAVVETVNASSYTGKITTDLSDLNSLKTYTGGSGVDAVTIDGAHTNDITVNLGAGNDTLSITHAGGETKALTVTLGAGADVITVANAGLGIGNVNLVDTNANFIKTLITVTDFNKAEDAVKVDVTTPATDRDTALLAESIAIEAAADLLAATKLAADTTAVGKVLTFGYKGDTYIFQNAGTAALDAGDTLIKLTGVAVGDITASNFELF